MRRTIRTILAAAVVAAPFPSSADAATPWPEHAQGRRLPRPAWILVVPARRAPDGTLTIWDRDDAWTRAWRVPRTVAGLRVVTLFGDSEDRRAIDARAVDGMMIDSLEVVRRKYGAPAIGLAVSDGGEAEVAAWVRGHPASWRPVTVGADAAATREAMVGALSDMLGSGGGGEASDADRAADAPTRVETPLAPALGKGGVVEVTAYRPRGDGSTDYRVSVTPASDASEALAGIRGMGPDVAVEVQGREEGRLSLVLTTTLSRDAFERSIRDAGFSVR